jgi:putative permease
MNVITKWLHRQLSDPQVVVMVLLMVTGLAVFLFLGRMLAPIFAALIIAYVLEGMVRFLVRQGAPRFSAVLLVFLAFMALLFMTFFGLLPLLFRQITQLVQQLPEMITSAQQALMQLPERYPRLISEDHVRDIISALRAEIGRIGQTILSFSIASVMTVITLLVYLVLMPFLVFFFLKDKSLIMDWIVRHLPRERGLSSQVWSEVDRQLGNYIRGKFIEIIIVWVVTFAVFYLLDLRYAMLLGLLVGLSVLIPYVGAVVVTLPIAMVAYTQWGFDSEFVYVLTAYGFIQLLDGNVLAPLLFAGMVHLHPVAIITAIFVFGGLWGFWGIFFAIPLATLVNAILKSWPREQLALALENENPG